jgi:hypothetical protein
MKKRKFKRQNSDKAKLVLENEWAANVIRTLKDKNTELKDLLVTLVELMERSDMEEFGEDCQSVTNGEWFSAIEKAKAAIG